MADDTYASRGGQKLAAGLDAFGIDPAGWTCADFGCNVGGFTDCLLQRRARRVYAVDTGYGALAWTLRQDGRVVVMERTNALHAEPHEPVDLVTIDVSVTPQVLIAPAAARWLRPGGCIVSLLKPSFEFAKIHGRKAHGALSDAEAEEVTAAVSRQLADVGLSPADRIESPLRGKGGNVECLLLIKP
ncbi:MAG: TlyA family rRNA (cytidine-2'-O)-methyltransferase [Planctomycetes bacterium]|nr:TlyA family rRNA (cytidine-2'-O)-methyltransferase [Phycisphaerae bacterium]NBB95407.1 TlyA family rRNA (cytidine-2'-O)-methyltransferase [Planctomycetota bacterium]